MRGRQFVTTNPPEPAAPEGFLLPSEWFGAARNFPAQAGTGDPDPGARAGMRVPKRAGPAGGNEAMSRTPMAGRTSKGSLWRRAVESAATEIRLSDLAGRIRAVQPALVVKMSDTSLHGKAGSNPACDARTGERSRQRSACAPARSPLRKEGFREASH